MRQKKPSKQLRHSGTRGSQKFGDKYCYIISYACLALFVLKETYTNENYSSWTPGTQILHFWMPNFMHSFSRHNAPGALWSIWYCASFRDKEIPKSSIQLKVVLLIVLSFYIYQTMRKQVRATLFDRNLLFDSLFLKSVVPE